MSEVSRALIGTWDVRFNQYRWTYSFSDGGKVTWRDPLTGKTGVGTWTNTGTAVAITWAKSTARETWNVPITPEKQMGQMKSDKTDGWFEAVKDQRKEHRFDTFSPEGQIDSNACWAASIAWITRVLSDTQTISQTTLLNSVNPNEMFRNGSVSPQALTTLTVPGGPWFNGLIGLRELKKYLLGDKFPIVIAFQASFGGHVNVIHSYDTTTDQVGVMEPWYPYPDATPGYYREEESGNYYSKATGTLFKFTGQMIRRPASYYTDHPTDGKFWVLKPA